MNLPLKKWISPLILLILFFIISLGFFYIYLSRDLPPLEMIYFYKPARVTYVLDRNKKVIYEFYTEKREPLPLDSISPKIQKAFITLEDKRFYKHFGIDILRLLKSIFVNLKERKFVQGASTITQQLARNMFLTFEKTLQRKLKEMILALRIERVFTKEEILERYLNLIYFGEGVYGVKAACNYFFNKSPKDVSWAEAALLAGIPRNPNYYSPFKNPSVSKKRRDFVLKILFKNKVIDEKTYKEALEEALPKKEKDERKNKKTGRYYFEEVKKYINSLYGEDFLYKEGVNIKLAMDLKLQETAESIIDSLLPVLDKRVRSYHKGKIYESDSLKLEVALLAVDVETGGVLALVGGRDFLKSQFNRAIQAKRQVGSSFKPFVYLTGIYSGIFPGDPVEDIPYVIEDDGTGKPWKPKNFDDKFLGFITVRDGLAFSRNLATVHILERVGPESVIEFVHRAGMKEYIPPVLSIALGSPSLSLWDMVQGYLTIANLGVKKKLYLIEEISMEDGRVIEKFSYKPDTVFDKKEVYILIDMMKSVFEYGTAKDARYYGFKGIAAGKTGTTDNFTDAWFIGFTPKILCGVWVGLDSLMKIFDKATGAVLALPIWANFMKRANKILGFPDSLDFERPEGIVNLRICLETGELATEFCPKKREEIYIKGREPKFPCTKHLGKSKTFKKYKRKF